MVVLAIGGISAAAGVLYAVLQQDLKRLLAYSTVENIGIIFVGIGLAMAFRASNMNLAAALALTAALYHILNHAVFKSLLFFGAGAVVNATGERNMDLLGGLIHRMPKTAVGFLIGCVAICALPPLNGFVSEWLTFQAILVSPQISQWGPRFLIPAVGALLALSAALAAACFVKAYGITFLGRPRTAAAEAAQETDGFSLAAMFLLAALCVILGVMPGAVVELISPVVQGLVGARVPAQSYLPWSSLVPIAESRSSYNGLIILFFIATSSIVTVLFVHRLATRATRRSAIWDCGYPDPSPATQYGGSSFAMPIRKVFGTTVFDVREEADIPRPGDIRAARYHVKVFDPLVALRLWSVRPLDFEIDGGAQQTAVPDHPELPHAGFRHADPAVARGGSMAMILELAAQAVQMLLVLAIAPLVLGITRKVKARALRRIGPPIVAALSRHLEADAQRGGARAQRIVALSRDALHRVRGDMGGRRADPDLCHQPDVLVGGRSHRTGGVAGDRAFRVGARRYGRRHLVRRHRLIARDDDRIAGGTSHAACGLYRRAGGGDHSIVDHCGDLHCRQCRSSGFARPRVGGFHPAGHRGERPHSNRQPRDAPRTHHGARGHGARIFRTASCDDRGCGGAQAGPLFFAAVCLFFPMGMATTDRSAEELGIGLAAYAGKIAILAVMLPIGETAIAKMRVFRYPVFLGSAFAAGALAVFLLFVSRSF